MKWENSYLTPVRTWVIERRNFNTDWDKLDFIQQESEGSGDASEKKKDSFEWWKAKKTKAASEPRNVIENKKKCNIFHQDIDFYHNIFIAGSISTAAFAHFHCLPNVLCEALCPSELQENNPVRHCKCCKCSQNAYEGNFLFLQTFSTV